MIAVLGALDRVTNKYRGTERDKLILQSIEFITVPMERKLRKNNHKPDWRCVSPDVLLLELKAEVRELREAMEQGTVADVLDESADVANMAMMIAISVRQERLQRLARE